MSPLSQSRRITPGSVILYRESRPDLPLWPSICLTDEATPKSFLETRPHGFYSVILKLGTVVNTSNLRWAQISQMIPFDPSAVNEVTKRSMPDLESAYKLAHEAEESAYDLDYWKVILASTQGPEVITIDSDDEDWSNDPDLLQAIKLSLLDDTSQRPQHQSKNTAAQSMLSNTRFHLSLPKSRSLVSHPTESRLPLPNCRTLGETKSLTPVPSPPRTYKRLEQSSTLSKRPLLHSSSESEHGTPTLLQKKLGSQFAGSEPFLFPSHSSHGPPSLASEISSEDTLMFPSCRKKWPNAKQVFQRIGLNASPSAAPDGDIVEENLDESSQFVQIFVGPEVDPASDSDIDPERRRHRLQLPKHHVWDRHYFRNTVSARNFFTPIGESTWELVHPRLVDILPADFRWAAEFLSDGDFGHRDPNEEEQVAETFAQCLSAWKTAETLNMDDLLEHIVKKLRAAQPWWDLWNVMAFACSIYQSDVSLQAHSDLKALFSEYIADLFFVYLEDDCLSGTFLTRLKQLPKLERDVLAKRIARLEARPQLQQDGAFVPPEADDDMSDNMDHTVS
ncbi:hypothetical protein SVAN01_00369 [Stagonosporopsis vannaccii]|nr:hypothetical protein SVAN01_00369 [Stagonosporopsis vannaccii]